MGKRGFKAQEEDRKIGTEKFDPFFSVLIFLSCLFAFCIAHFCADDQIRTLINRTALAAVGRSENRGLAPSG
jgi:hypothetical protein